MVGKIANHRANDSKESKLLLETTLLELLRCTKGEERHQRLVELAGWMTGTDVPLLLNIYGTEQNENVQAGIVTILSYMGARAVPQLVHQLTEGDRIRRKCAYHALSKIEASCPHLLPLLHADPPLNDLVIRILSQLCESIGYPSLDHLLAEYGDVERPTRKSPSISNLRMKGAIVSLEEAKKCLDMDLYSPAIEACDRAVQRLIPILLKFFGIDLGEDTNSMPQVLTKLREARVRLRCERNIRWLRDIRNDIRYELKQSTHNEARHAYRAGWLFVKEVQTLLKLRPHLESDIPDGTKNGV